MSCLFPRSLDPLPRPAFLASPLDDTRSATQADTQPNQVINLKGLTLSLAGSKRDLMQVMVEAKPAF